MRSSHHLRGLVHVAALAFELRGIAAGEVQLLPAGEFRAADGRPKEAPAWRIDATIAQRVIARAAALQRQMVIDFEHQTINAEKNGMPAPAGGWFKQLEWREGQGLWATDVQWTDRARQMIEAGEYKYISPVFAYDPKTGEVLAMHMAALTNFPGLDGMAEVLARAAARFEVIDQENTVNELLKTLLATLGLPETTKEDAAIAAVAAMKATADKSTALEGEVATLKAQTPDPAKYVPIATMKELQDQVAALSQSQTQRDIDELLTAALSDGRLLAAQETWARDLGKANIGALREYLKTAAPIAALRGTQTKGKPPTTEIPAGGDPVAVAKANWESTAALREEFVDLDSYTAYLKAHNEGRVKIHGHRAD